MLHHTTCRTPRLLNQPLRILVLLGIFAPSPGAAVSTVVLSLDDAQQLVLERNASLQRQANSVSASEVSVDQARAALYPDLRFTVNTAERFSQETEPTTRDLDGRRTTSLSVQASSRLNLFNGFGDVAAIEAARQSTAASTNDLQRSREISQKRSRILAGSTLFVIVTDNWRAISAGSIQPHVGITLRRSARFFQQKRER